MDSVAIVIAGVVGLCFGSFATSLAWRIPRGLSWIKSRSCCTSCGAQLTVRDLVPVLSWLVARGRCRHCGVSISKRYPVTELTLAALFALAAWRSPGIEIFLP
ncbi:MAG: prepilin peptidase, partial [Pseudomonadota bacterium]|nr:prepilin peptidase [Pseudomonadota bacterium]